MRIVVMGTGQGLGGLHTHFQRLMRFLVAEGHETTALAVADASANFELPPGVRDGGRIPHSADTLRQKVSKLLRLWRVQARMRRLAPELFVATATGGAYARVARAARRSGAFAIWQEVMLPSPGDPLHVEMSSSVDAVAVQTPMMLRPFREAIANAPAVASLPCFFEPPQTNSIASRPGAGEPIHLAYFGRLAGNKGLVPFLDALKAVAVDFRVRLDIHGEGEQREAIGRKIVEAGLQDTVSLMGRYPDGGRYGDRLVSYHALVLPSVECEGLPLVLLEAMSCGLPFLSTTVGGIPEVARENRDVLVVSPDVASLTAGLHELLAKVIHGAISNERLCAFAKARFSNEHFATAWRRMLANPRGFFHP